MVYVIIVAVCVYIIYVQYDELQIRERDENKYNQNTKNHD